VPAGMASIRATPDRRRLSAAGTDAGVCGDHGLRLRVASARRVDFGAGTSKQLSARAPGPSTWCSPRAAGASAQGHLSGGVPLCRNRLREHESIGAAAPHSPKQASCASNRTQSRNRRRRLRGMRPGATIFSTRAPRCRCRADVEYLARRRRRDDRAAA
jgi:hypothetical protein